MKISKIVLYAEPTVPEIRIKELAEFLRKTFPDKKVEMQKEFVWGVDSDILERVAGTRIFDLKKPFERHLPSAGDISTEINDAIKDEAAVMHDGFEFCRIVSECIPQKEREADVMHIVFTDRLICTFDESDFRYHARTWVGSNPAIISTTGMIEAPAKPRQYYLDLMTSLSEEETAQIKERYKGRFLEYHDPRLAEIAEGYVLQAVVYYETGDAFCEDASCRLYNAHWQSKVFHSQIKNKKFCARHKKVLKRLGGRS